MNSLIDKVSCTAFSYRRNNGCGFFYILRLSQDKSRTDTRLPFSIFSSPSGTAIIPLAWAID